MRVLISLRRFLAFGVVVAVVVLGSAVAQAGILTSDFVRPVSVSASSEYNSARGAVHTINGSGLNALGQHGTTGDGNMWMTSSGAVPAWIQYDLGVPTTLSGFHLWNFNMVIGANAYTGRGIKDATVQTSMDGVHWSSAAGSYSPFTQGSVANYAGEDYSFSGPLRARYVRIDGQNTHDGGGYAGLSEIRFTTPNLITGVDATASSEYSNRVGQRTVDGSGMSGFGLERADAGYSTSMWMSNLNEVVGETITFDLQDVHPLQAVRVWNFNGRVGTTSLSDRGIETFDIAVSLDGVTYQTLTGPSSGHFSLTEAPGAAEYLTPDMIDLGTVLARYVRFTVVDNYGGSYVGLSEVRFYEGVPEPSAIVLLGLGLFAVMGFARRSLRRS